MTRKEAIEIIKTQYPHDHVIKTALGLLIPELHESENERTRNEIIAFIEQAIHGGGGTIVPLEKEARWLTYLEKQKEIDSTPLDWNDYKDKPIEVWNAYLRGKAAGIEIEKQKEKKPEIKYVYPKFRKGDVIVPITPNGHYEPVRVVDICNGSYSCRSDDNKAYLSLPIKQEDKYRLVEQKPTEWSEEDERYVNGLIGLIEDMKVGISPKLRGVTADKCIAFLKHLRPSWKPSEEQMALLLAVINDPNNAGSESCQLALRGIYEQLKKL